MSSCKYNFGLVFFILLCVGIVIFQEKILFFFLLGVLVLLTYVGLGVAFFLHCLRNICNLMFTKLINYLAGLNWNNPKSVIVNIFGF